jgi:hypothetical protein
VRGRAQTTSTLDWGFLEAGNTVLAECDSFVLENMRSNDAGTALVADQGGCYALGYLANVGFDATGPVEVYLTVNGNALLPPSVVDPVGEGTTVATDLKPAVPLQPGDEVALELYNTASGTLSVTPSAWVEARRTGDAC